MLRHCRYLGVHAAMTEHCPPEIVSESIERFCLILSDKIQICTAEG